jgi:hypothetical protein
MPILLSDEELEALEGLPHLHRCLYIFGIRRYMDYETGITGIKRKISYKSLSEEVYVIPHQGFTDAKTKSVAQLKRAVKALEKAGLITMHSKVSSTEKQLILKCILASWDKSVQNKPVPYPYHSPIPQAALVENNEIPENTDTLEQSQPKSRTESRTTQNKKPVPHPVSDKLHNITLPSAQDFFQLLAKCGFALQQLQGNKSTLAMVHQWVQAKVTLEEAQIGINHVNSSKGTPNSPAYYLKPVLQVRSDFEKAQLQADEVKHDRRQTKRPAPTPHQRYPKSATKQFWERQEEILRGFNNDED